MKPKLLTDIARDLLRAVSFVLHKTQLHREDEKYIILQLCKHYVYYYLYFEYMDKDQYSEANLYSVKADTAKKNVTEFFQNKMETTQYYGTIYGIFGKNN